MKILFLTVTCPFPANNGLTMRSSSILQALAKLGHEVDVVFFASNGASVNGDCRLTSLCRYVLPVFASVGSLSAKGAYVSRVRKLLSKDPYSVHRFASSEMRSAIAEIVRRRDYDLLLCDTVFSAINLPKGLIVPVVLNCHNIEHIILRRYAIQEPNPAKRLYGSLEAAKLRDWERLICNRAQLTLACSNIDQRLLQQLCGQINVIVVPNAIDTEAYISSSQEDETT